MESSCVHHVEFGVRHGEEFQRRLSQQYNFSLIATRETVNLKQWVLRSGTATVLLTQSTSPISCESDPYHIEWQNPKDICQLEKHYSFDSVYNVALKVKNIETCVQKLTRSNVEIIRPIQMFKDDNGEVSIAIVKSCIGNVVHTIVQDDGYSGTFLPGFKNACSSRLCDINDKLITHFDHVTFACECGQSDKILDWYSRCFGMCRFLINRDENEDTGFVIDTEDIGLRLKAFEYWKCAETGLSSGHHPESIKFVIAEALPNQGPNQVDTFLHDHQGPGVQHIGLHTSNIVHTVSQLKQNGVEFAEPPYTYYTEVGKLEEICDIGQNVAILRDNGILVDAEADPSENVMENGSNGSSPNLRYLMQKFTKPLFDRNTFFLEIIHRVGARGFGSGNITALWRSVQAYMNSQQQEKS